MSEELDRHQESASATGGTKKDDIESIEQLTSSLQREAIQMGSVVDEISCSLLAHVKNGVQHIVASTPDQLVSLEDDCALATNKRFLDAVALIKKMEQVG